MATINMNENVGKGRPRLTIEDCKKVAEERGGECLSTEYIDAHAKMKWRCKHGHEWESTLNAISHKKTWCPICARKSKYSLEYCKELAAERGGKCLSEVYINTSTPMEWECEHGHKWTTRLNQILRGNWCKQCYYIGKRLTIEDCQKEAAKRGGKCLSTEYVNIDTPMEWECKHGHRWKTAFNSIKNTKTWCPKCSTKKLTLKACQEVAAEHGGKCLSTEYINCNTPMEWECEHGHKFTRTLNSVKNLKKWCQVCIKNEADAKKQKAYRKITPKPRKQVELKITDAGINELLDIIKSGLDY